MELKQKSIEKNTLFREKELKETFKKKKEVPKDFKIVNGEHSLIIGNSEHGKIGIKTVSNELDTDHYFYDIRMIIAGISGSGKSYLTRNLIEKCYKNKIGNIIIFDPQGEYISLIRDLPFLVIGGDKSQCDVVMDPTRAYNYAQIIIKNKIPTLIDFSSFKEEKSEIMWATNANFIAGALTLEKGAFYPTSFFWEEAHMFAKASSTGPEVGIESRNRLKEIASIGRKYDYSLFFITQRISHLHQDIAAQLNNKIIGRNDIKSDVKRCSDLLNLPEKVFSDLDYEFYAAGQYFDHFKYRYPIKFKSLKPKSEFNKSDRFDDFARQAIVKQWIKYFDNKSFLSNI